MGTVFVIWAGVFQVVHPFNAGMDGPNVGIAVPRNSFGVESIRAIKSYW